jgi:hypothetical protein
VSSPLKHVPVEVDPDAVDAAPVQFDGDPAGAASGVEDRGRTVPSDETRLAVYVMAGGGETLEPFVVVGAAGNLRSRPARAHHQIVTDG